MDIGYPLIFGAGAEGVDKLFFFIFFCVILIKQKNYVF